MHEGAAVTVGCALWSGHAGCAARCCCQSGVCFWAGMQVPMHEGAAVTVGCVAWSGHAGCAARCCFQSGVCLWAGMQVPLLSRWGVRFGAGMLVVLRGAAVQSGVCFWAGMQVPMQGAAARCCLSVQWGALWSGYTGGAARCCSKGCLQLMDLGGGDVCYEVLWQGLAARCPWQCGVGP